MVWLCHMGNGLVNGLLPPICEDKEHKHYHSIGSWMMWKTIDEKLVLCCLKCELPIVRKLSTKRLNNSEFWKTIDSIGNETLQGLLESIYDGSINEEQKWMIINYIIDRELKEDE